MFWGQDTKTHRFGLVGGAIAVAASLALPLPPVTADATITLLFTGDVLVHTPVTASAFRYGQATGVAHDFKPMFSEVSPLIGAVDWSVCHLEVAIGVPGVIASPFPRIAAPATVAEGFAASGSTPVQRPPTIHLTSAPRESQPLSPPSMLVGLPTRVPRQGPGMPTVSSTKWLA